jgi:hypothetical protein
MRGISGGLAYIASMQRDSGGFQSYRLAESNDRESKSYDTTFIPSLILLSLKDVPGSKALRTRIAKFLLQQKNENWSWNYWNRDSVSARDMPCPDDLDATFVAMTALWYYDRSLITPKVTAKMTRLLFATEQNVGGPYRTWLVDETSDAKWRDVDTIVTINIGGFLSLLDVSLAAIDELIEASLNSKNLTSPYYPALQPAGYFLARWYKGPQVEELRHMILTHWQADSDKSPHLAALTVSALLRLGYSPNELGEIVDGIKNSQLSDGSWPAGPICTDPMRANDRSVYFTGCQAMTTALCLEALTLYKEATKPIQKRSVQSHDRHYKTVIAHAENVIKNLVHVELKASVGAIFKRIKQQDSDGQIILLPSLIAKAATIKTPESVLVRLGVLSLWGWMAYTTYDDFLDDEGEPKLLPGAMFAQRQLTATITRTFADNQMFQDEVSAILDRIDQANVWEIEHCRAEIRDGRLTIAQLPDYGDYWQLADRSLGHSISGLGILYQAGLKSDSQMMNGLRDFFTQYLIARQLNDDAHDWEDDLSRGHINAAGVLILSEWAKDHDLSGGIDVEHEREVLRLIMWEHSIDVLVVRIQDHIEKARNAIMYAGLDPEVLEPLLAPLESASKNALSARDDAIEFMSSL